MKNQKNMGSLFIPAGLFLGIGIGMFKGNVAAGTLIGLGAGFLLFAVASIIKSK